MEMRQTFSSKEMRCSTFRLKNEIVDEIHNSDCVNLFPIHSGNLSKNSTLNSTVTNIRMFYTDFEEKNWGNQVITSRNEASDKIDEEGFADAKRF
jgi:hypothetical protein